MWGSVICLTVVHNVALPRVFPHVCEDCMRLMYIIGGHHIVSAKNEMEHFTLLCRQRTAAMQNFRIRVLKPRVFPAIMSPRLLSWLDRTVQHPATSPFERSAIMSTKAKMVFANFACRIFSDVELIRTVSRSRRFRHTLSSRVQCAEQQCQADACPPQTEGGSRPEMMPLLLASLCSCIHCESASIKLLGVDVSRHPDELFYHCDTGFPALL